jgi:hypothetical protein
MSKSLQIKPNRLVERQIICRCIIGISAVLTGIAGFDMKLFHGCPELLPRPFSARRHPNQQIIQAHLRSLQILRASRL